MAVLIRIPTPPRGFTNGRATLEAEGTTVSGVLLDLVGKYPAIRDKLYDSEGLRMFIKIYRSNDNRFLANPGTSVKDGDQASILAAVAGVFPLTPDRGSAMPVGEKVPWTVEGQSWNLVLGHAVGSYPKEACGILLVHGQRPHHITEVRPTRNATSGNPAKRYVIDPLEFLDVDKWAEQRGLIICGFYHSHPDHPPAPSDYDRELAWEGYLYLILSIKGGIFDEARAWIWNIDEVRFEEVIFRSPDKKGHNRNPQC